MVAFFFTDFIDCNALCCRVTNFYFIPFGKDYRKLQSFELEAKIARAIRKIYSFEFENFKNIDQFSN